jgi:hypothetical protein
MTRIAFAFAVALGLGALLLPAVSSAKPGGGFGGKAMHSGAHHSGKLGHKLSGKHGHKVKHGHKFSHKSAGRFAHKHGRHSRDVSLADWSWPLTTAVVQERDQVRGENAPAPVVQKIYQAGGNGGCSTERVTVPTSKGEGEVNMIRCWSVRSVAVTPELDK